MTVNTKRRRNPQPWGDGEIDSIYVESTDRFVVSLIASYDDTDVKTPHQAAKAALDLMLDEGSGGTLWYVYDRQTGVMTQLEQGDFQNEDIP